MFIETNRDSYVSTVVVGAIVKLDVDAVDVEIGVDAIGIKVVVVKAVDIAMFCVEVVETFITVFSEEFTFTIADAAVVVSAVVVAVVVVSAVVVAVAVVVAAVVVAAVVVAVVVVGAVGFTW